MPSKTLKQANFMRAVAHDPRFARKVGVPQSVGQDFADADTKARFAHALRFAVGGQVRSNQMGTTAPGANDPGPAPTGATNVAPPPGGTAASNGAKQLAANLPGNALNPNAPATIAGMKPAGTYSYTNNDGTTNSDGSHVATDANGTPGYAYSNMQFHPGQYAGLRDASGNALTGLYGALQDQMAGKGPNPALQQFKQTTDRNIAQQYAMAQGNPNDAGAARNAANAASTANQQASSDAATLRQNQQLQAQQLLGQTALGGYGTAGRLMTDQEKLALDQAQGNQNSWLNQNAAAIQQQNLVTGSAMKAGGETLQSIISQYKQPAGSGGGGSGTETDGGGSDDKPSEPADPGTTSAGGDVGSPLRAGPPRPQNLSYTRNPQYAHGGFVNALRYAVGGPVHRGVEGPVGHDIPQYRPQSYAAGGPVRPQHPQWVTMGPVRPQHPQWATMGPVDYAPESGVDDPHPGQLLGSQSYYSPGGGQTIVMPSSGGNGVPSPVIAPADIPQSQAPSVQISQPVVTDSQKKEAEEITRKMSDLQDRIAEQNRMSKEKLGDMAQQFERRSQEQDAGLEAILARQYAREHGQDPDAPPPSNYADGGFVPPNQIYDPSRYTDYSAQTPGSSDPGVSSDPSFKPAVTGYQPPRTQGQSQEAKDIQTGTNVAYSVMPYGAAVKGIHDIANKPVASWMDSWPEWLKPYNLQRDDQIREDIKKNGHPQGMGGHAHGGLIQNLTSGGGVPGRAKVSGDNLKNDTVPAKLSPGEIVLPRTVTQAEDAPEKARAFVQAIKKHKDTPIKSYGQVLMKQRELRARAAALGK